MFTELARRGLSHANTLALVERAVAASPYDHETPTDIPVWGVIVLYTSLIVMAVGFSLLSYMLNNVVATLCMVESPMATVTVSPSRHEPGSKEEQKDLLETEETVVLAHQKPITSGIRSTIRHITAHAGRFARFRGTKLHALYSILFSLVSTFFSAALPLFPGQSIFVAALSGAAVATVHATWLHKVLSTSTDAPLRTRLVPLSHWKTLALPAAIQAAMPYIALHLVCGVIMLLGLHKLDHVEKTGASIAYVIVSCLVVVVFTLACTLFLTLPATVTLVRIEASLLPAEQDTIVPFDRTFNGKINAHAQAKVGFLDAWRSFTWEARRRLIKLFVKTFFILVGLVFIMVHVLIAEIFVIFGPRNWDLLVEVSANFLRSWQSSQ